VSSFRIVEALNIVEHIGLGLIPGSVQARGISPYGFVKSRNYKFTAVKWVSSRLFELRSEWDDFDPICKGCISKGRSLSRRSEFGKIYWMATYMREHKNFPQPIVMLDNRDDHLKKEYPAAWRVPAAFILVEGHMRFNIRAYLQTIGGLNPTVDVWLMEKSSH